jgi:anti-sigma factor RsiW
VLAGVLLDRTSTRAEQARLAFLSEAVSDHLRALASERGPELSSGANHEVKPWFEGRVDFAPMVPVPDVPELRLRGGSIGYFLDRRAAVVSYTLRRHAVTLLAFRPEGLDLPEVPGGGKVDLRSGGVRGFRVVAWRAGGVGYALVSDVPQQELQAIAATFAPVTAGPR